MALIQCKNCGNDVSDKAIVCPHCGERLIEEIVEKRFCEDCGSELPVDAEICPNCGCPVEKPKQDEVVSQVVNQVAKKVQKNKKLIGIVAIVAAVVVLLFLIIGLMGSTLNEDEQLAYQNALEMKSMMKDPDSFRLYDEMMLLKHFDDNGENDYTYTIFKYGGANGYGAITTDEAIFKDGEFIMNYADEPDKDDYNYKEQLYVQVDLLSWQILGDPEKWESVEIDVEKIKNKMGLE